jgi:Mg-chelatase subunit ChlD
MEPTRDEQYAALHGTVRGPSGPPLSGARVLVTSDDHRHLYGTAISATGAAHGRYQILSLPPEEPLLLYAYHENVPGVLYSRQLTLTVNEFRDQPIMLEVRHRDPGMIDSLPERLPVLLEQNQRRQWAGDLRGMLDAMANMEQRRTGRAHVLLLIDSSASMQDNDPGDVRHSVARYVADRLPAAAALGLLDFDGEAKVLVPVQEGDRPRRAVRDAVARIDADGGTNIGGALEAGLGQFHSTAPAARRAAILLTDGQGEYDDQAATYASQGITLYTVGLGDQCDEALLSAMATQTGGAYFKAGEAGGLFQSFEAAIVDVNDEQSFFTEQGTMVPEEHRYVTFDVEVGLDRLVSMITWPGSDLDLRLYGPDGQEVAAQRTAADRYEILRVDHPQPGRWRAEIEAVDVPDAGEPFTFAASGPSDVRLVVDAWPDNEDGGDRNLSVRLTGGADLRGLEGHLLVEAPDGRTVTVPLRRGADPTILTAGADWATRPGDYQVRVVAEARRRGGKLRRELHRTLHVTGGATPTAEDRLIGDLSARDAGTRLRAVEELGRREHQGAVPAIRELLGDPSAEVRTAAAWALARLEKSTP